MARVTSGLSDGAAVEPGIWSDPVSRPANWNDNAEAGPVELVPAASRYCGCTTRILKANVPQRAPNASSAYRTQPAVFIEKSHAKAPGPRSSIIATGC